MVATRRNNFRGGGFSRWDRRDVGLRPENALSRADRTFEFALLVSLFRI